MGLFTGSKTKRLAKELSETKKLLERERQRAEVEAGERQDLEIRLWRAEGEIRKYQYQEKRIRDVWKYEFWKQISLLYTMDETDLERVVRLDNLFHDAAAGKWGVVECYCVQCGKALQTRYFNSALEALQYMAVKQVLGIAPAFDTCMGCCQEKLMECA